jgi:hypothetical protein
VNIVTKILVIICQNFSSNPMDHTTQPILSNKDSPHSKPSPTASKTSRRHYGWFSPESKARGNNTHIYLNESGDRVEVTCVTRTADHGTGWDDIITMVNVYKYVETINNQKESKINKNRV